MYINTFMIKQRAKEFATYSLFGMDKNKLSVMYIGEISMIGTICVALGVSFLLMIGMPFVNYMLNDILSVTGNNEVLKAFGLFVIFFAILYLGYYQVVYCIIKRYIASSVKIHF